MASLFCTCTAALYEFNCSSNTEPDHILFFCLQVKTAPDKGFNHVHTMLSYEAFLNILFLDIIQCFRENKSLTTAMLQ